jgi:hypothetical protein
MEETRYKELNDLYFSTYIFRVIKLRIMIWARHIPFMGERRSLYMVLVGKPEGKERLEDSGVDKRIILKWIITKWDGGAWTGLIWLRIGTGGALMKLLVP